MRCLPLSFDGLCLVAREVPIIVTHFFKESFLLEPFCKKGSTDIHEKCKRSDLMGWRSPEIKQKKGVIGGRVDTGCVTRSAQSYETT